MTQPIVTNQQIYPPTNQTKSSWQVWWRLLRPHTLTASFVPVLIGTALAYPLKPLNISAFLAMLLASMLIQSATNMFNEYFDFKRGLDTAESVGIGGTIVRDGIEPRKIKNLAFRCLILAFFLGLYICFYTSWWLALIGIICMSIGYFYTGGPYPISSTPWGELVSGVFMGAFIILISFYIQTGTVTEKSIWFSIPTTILIGAILMSNNIRDLDGDKKSGRHTLAILLGRKKAIVFLALMFITAYLWSGYMILFGDQSLWLLLVWASVPLAIKAVKGFLGKSVPVEMMPAMKATAQTNTLFGILLVIALYLQ